MALVEGRTEAVASESGAEPLAPEPDLRTSDGSARRWLWLIVAVTVFAGAALGVAYRHTVGHQIAISVSRQSTAFTQLYFTHPDDLPKRLAVPGPDSFSFTIDNREGHSTSYAYTVTLASPLATSVVSEGTLRVADGGTIDKTIDIVPSAPMTDYEVTVRLAQGGEVIHFQGGAQ